MKFKEYQNNNTAYILMRVHGSAPVRNGKYYVTEAPSPAKAKANIIHRLRNSVKNNIEWNIVNNPDEYAVMPYDEWKDKQPANHPKRSIPEPKPSQQELFNPQRWID